MHRQRWPLWVGLLLVGVGLVLVLTDWPHPKLPLPVEQPGSTFTGPTPEPLIPTQTPTQSVQPASPATGTRTPTEVASLPAPTVAPTPFENAPAPSPSAVGAPAVNELWMGRPRWGIGVPIGPISRYNVAPLHLGWYLDWGAQRDPPLPEGVEYVQMVRLKYGELRPGVQELSAIAAANPGSLWLVGNEPDVRWQDSVEPDVYARLYHEVYAAAKGADSTAQVAIGGVSQPTPLRLRYLDAVLTSYQTQFGTEMPVDVWNVHNFVLREEQDSWGVDIPPGLPDNQGMLYEIDDCDDLAIFRQQIVDFRRWMSGRGYQDRPLIVSEYGVPMPEEYGFSQERVAAFLTGTFDFLLTAVDQAVGYPADGYRLVQRWCWYSLDDTVYPTGRLFDPQTGRMTTVGMKWTEYVEERG